MILVLVMMMLLMASLFLVNFILRERIKRNKILFFQKREVTNSISFLRFYEKSQGKDNWIEYLLGQERIWMKKDKISPGGYRIERIIRNNQIIYTQESIELPGDMSRKYLSSVSPSSYKIVVIKYIKVEESKEFAIRAEIQVDFVKGNLDQSRPDLELFLEMTVREQ